MTMLTFEEFKKIAKGLKAVYTSQTFLPDEDSLKTWYHMLKDIPYEWLSMASYKYMATDKFPPTIAELRKGVLQLAEPTGDWSDGWQQVQNAIRRYGMYQEQEALNSMDELTRTIAKRLGWKSLCTSDNQMTDRANFRMAYEEAANVTKEKAVLPEKLSKQIAAIQNKALIGGANETS